MQAYRIADRRYPIFDGAGPRIHGARWNSPGRPVIYGAATYAGAMLEVLVHANLGRPPKTHSLVEIEIPLSVGIESWMGVGVPDVHAAREFGDQWLAEARTAVLLVPSAVSGGREKNVLINPQHPDFGQILAGEPEPVAWDPRLFVG
jgi:RES domain-containing protein